MNRLKALTPSCLDQDSVKRAQALQDVELAFTLSVPKLRQIQLAFLAEMLNGLRDTESSSIKMLTSYVVKRDTSRVSGFYYALDLGGTNFRVWKLTVKNGQVVETAQHKYAIPSEHMGGDADGLFDFIAKSCKSFVPHHATGDLGFTFSFPVDQKAIDEGSLIAWTKGFTTRGVEGVDVVKLLRRSFDREGLKLNVVALCNDTVGTLVTEYFKDPASCVGVILGTGSNACYWEEVGNITKYATKNPNAKVNDLMCINMEWGNFDSVAQKVLPITKYDTLVDFNSPNAGAQLFEKMMSGMYLGEVARYVFLSLQQKKLLPPMDGIEIPQSFGAHHLSTFLADRSPDLCDIEKFLRGEFRAQSNLLQRQIMREVCQLVSGRAARLAATGVATIIAKMGAEANATVSIDGSVFEKIPGFKQVMEATLDELFEGQTHKIRLVLTNGGSGVGAGLIAALATQRSAL